MNPTSRQGFTIGRLSRSTGCKVQTIRFYEQIGLLPQPTRSEGNQRLYTEADADRLCFVRHCRELGFSLDAIRELLSLADHRTGPVPPPTSSPRRISARSSSGSLGCAPCRASCGG